MRNALAAALWLCVLALLFIAPTSLPDDRHAAARAWALLAVALVLAVVAMCVEAGA